MKMCYRVMVLLDVSTLNTLAHFHVTPLCAVTISMCLFMFSAALCLSVIAEIRLVTDNVCFVMLKRKNLKNTAFS